MPDNQFKDQLEEFSYSLGLTISSNLIQSGVKNLDSLQFLAGIQDTFAGNKSKISLDEANQVLQEFMLASNEEEAKKKLRGGIIISFK